MHSDPVAQIVLDLLIILIGAKLMGALAHLAKQPAVLGELLFGVLLGNLDLAGIHRFEPISTNPIVDALGRIGLLLLLFEVGLESTVGQMLKVGARSLAVALVGVVVPFALGWAAGALLLPNASGYVHAFLGATLTATSVGITARVLKDLARSQTREARIILGAAVIDDVLGLVVLAVMSGVVAATARGGHLSAGEMGLVIGKASGFLVGAIAIGVAVTGRLFRLAAKVPTSGVLLALGLSVCFGLSVAADKVGLAPLVGAFAAGLILEDLHYRDFMARGEPSLHELISPLVGFLAPVFFVLMGMHTDLRAFASTKVLALGGVLTVVAVVGKLAAGAVAGSVDRLTVGIGMVPRGEVGLVFASIGQQLTLGGLPLVSKDNYAAILVMVILTTMMTPPALRWSLRRGAT